MSRSRLLIALRNSQGITLIEVLIVIAILAILMMLAVVNGPRFVTKAHDARRKTDLEAYKVAFEHYYEDHQCYPDQATLDQCGSTTTDLKPYLPKILCDPLTKGPYQFYMDGCNSYKIYTVLDNEDDPEIARIGCTLGCGPEGEEIYNYGVSSSNTRVGDPMSTYVGGGNNDGDDGDSSGGSGNPAGESIGGGQYNPMTCTLQPDETWNCSCAIGSSCGIDCPGNTLCSDDGTYCYTDSVQCPIGG